METSDDQQVRREPKLVLIADDEAPIAEALAMIIEAAGHRTVIAKHGEAALALARAERPALIFTDLMMPRLDGASLIKILRADAAAAGIAPPPIVLMTAGGLYEAHQAGADAVLPKPFNLTEVEALLTRFLDTPGADEA
ncbi:MAG: response regulator [Ktedonobacterales bacterium]|nr:response regulator [Ktedonobacterales bacterium]